MNLLLYRDTFDTVLNDVFYVRLRTDTYTLEEFFDSLFYSCWFPRKIESWEELVDMLKFSFIEENNIVIHHESLPKIQEEYIVAYIRCLIGELNRKNDIKNVKYIFSEKEKNRISAIIDDLKNRRI